MTLPRAGGRFAGEPAEEQKGALGVWAGSAGDQQFVQTLPGNTEGAGEPRLVAEAPEAGGAGTGEFVPDRRIRAGAERFAGPAAAVPLEGTTRFRGEAIARFECCDDGIEEIETGMVGRDHTGRHAGIGESVIY